MQDLFANGFWSTVNNNFNDVKHQIKEYQKSPNALDIEYDYNIYQTNYKGKGTYIQASDTEIFILSQDKVLSLKKDTPGLKITLLKTSKTNNKIHENKIEINDLKESELNNLLKNKFIAAATIYSNFGTTLSINPLEIKKKFTIENKYNLTFISHVQDTLFEKREKIITDIELKLKSEENQLINDNKSYYLDLAVLQDEKNKLKSDLSNYELNETKKNIIELEDKIENYKPKTNLMIAEYKKQLQKIKNDKIGSITYSGNVTYIEIIK
jgi:inner membrane protein